MKDFSFSLQSLLDAKNALERLGEMKIGTALKEKDRLRRGLERLNKLMRNEVIRIEAGNDDSGTASNALPMHFMYMNKLRSRCDEQVEMICACEMNILTLREDLVRIMKDKKAYERLKDNEYQQWKLEMSRIERREMDAIAATSFMRNRKIA